MLDDERRVLGEIEDHLRMADPAFVARMSPSQTRQFPTITALSVLLLVAAPLIGLLAGPAAVGLTAAAVLAIMIATVLRRIRRRERAAPH